MSAAAEFFRELYRHAGDGYLELRMLPSRQQSFMESTDDAAAAAERIKNQNVYFGVGRRIRESGTKEDVSALPCVWVDVDTKDFPNENAAKKALWNGRPPGGWSAIVATGGGFHAYAILSEPVEREGFHRVEAINRGLAKAIGGDPRACDAARILRVPGTYNCKYDTPRLVRVAIADWSVEYGSLDEFERWEELGGEVVPTRDLSGDLSEDVRSLIESCDFLRYARDCAKTLPEPLWYAMISNLVSMRGSVRAIHEMSREHPGYNRRSTDEKILHALDASGPITCAKIRADGFHCTRTCGVAAPAGLVFRNAAQPKGENPYEAIDGARKAMVEEAIPPDGFIDQYVKYCTALTDAPKIFHLFSGLTLLSATVGRRIQTDGFGGRPLFPNLWTVILAPSSVYRKSTAIGIAEDFMGSVGLKLLPQEFSQEQLIVDLQDHPHSTFVWSEFGSALGNFQKEYMAGTKDVLAALYDCPDQYQRKLRSGELNVVNPYISILGATNVDWMANKGITNDLRGGFLARILYVPCTSKDYEMDSPGHRDHVFRQSLVNSLCEVQRMAATSFSFKHLEGRRRELRCELDEIARVSEYTVEMSAAFSRYQAVAIKLAMLYAVSIGQWGGEIAPECFEWAVTCIRILKSSLEDLLRGVPLNRDDELMVEVKRKMLALHQNGAKWINRRDLVKLLHRKTSTVDSCLADLREMGAVKEDVVSTGARGPKTHMYQLVV